MNTEMKIQWLEKLMNSMDERDVHYEACLNRLKALILEYPHSELRNDDWFAVHFL